jgi:hypothetical protein
MLKKTIKFNGIGISPDSPDSTDVTIIAKLDDVIVYDGSIDAIDSIDGSNIGIGNQSVVLFTTEVGARDISNRSVSISVSGGSLVLFPPDLTHKLEINIDFPFYELSHEFNPDIHTVSWETFVHVYSLIADPEFTEEELALLSSRTELDDEIEDLLVQHHASIVMPGILESADLYDFEPRSNVMIDGEVVPPLDVPDHDAMYLVPEGQTVTFDLQLIEIFK